MSVAFKESGVNQDGLRSALEERNTKHATDTRKKSLFAMVDTDKNGTIDEAEFGELYDIVKEQTAEDIRKEDRAAKKSKVLSATVVVLATFLGVQLAGTTGLIYLTKDVYTASKGNHPYMTDSSGRAMGTVGMQEGFRLANLPAMHASENEVSIENIRLTDPDGAIHSYKTAGYSWFNSTHMDLYLQIGGTLHIGDGHVWLDEDQSDAAPGRRRLRAVRGPSIRNNGASNSASKGDGGGSGTDVRVDFTTVKFVMDDYYIF